MCSQGGASSLCTEVAKETATISDRLQNASSLAVSPHARDVCAVGYRITNVFNRRPAGSVQREFRNGALLCIHSQFLLQFHFREM